MAKQYDPQKMYRFFMRETARVAGATLADVASAIPYSRITALIEFANLVPDTLRGRSFTQRVDSLIEASELAGRLDAARAAGFADAVN